MRLNEGSGRRVRFFGRLEREIWYFEFWYGCCWWKDCLGEEGGKFRRNRELLYNDLGLGSYVIILMINKIYLGNCLNNFCWVDFFLKFFLLVFKWGYFKRIRYMRVIYLNFGYEEVF